MNSGPFEVETAKALENDPQHIIKQVHGFRTDGYRRVLVVPKASMDAASELCKEIAGTVHVSTPSGVDEYL